MVEVTEPETVIRLDAPAGLVTTRVKVKDGKAESVTLENVASYSHALDQAVEVAGFGEVRYDIAYGGNFYAFVHLEDLGIEFDRRNGQQMLEAGLAIMDAINEQNPVAHPENPEINVCHHVYLEAPGSTAQHSRHAMAIHPGWFDRSPCGSSRGRRPARG